MVVDNISASLGGGMRELIDDGNQRRTVGILDGLVLWSVVLHAEKREDGGQVLVQLVHLVKRRIGRFGEATLHLVDKSTTHADDTRVKVLDGAVDLPARRVLTDLVELGRVFILPDEQGLRHRGEVRLGDGPEAVGDNVLEELEVLQDFLVEGLVFSLLLAVRLLLASFCGLWLVGRLLLVRSLLLVGGRFVLGFVLLLRGRGLLLLGGLLILTRHLEGREKNVESWNKKTGSFYGSGTGGDERGSSRARVCEREMWCWVVLIEKSIQ